MEEENKGAKVRRGETRQSSQKPKSRLLFALRCSVNDQQAGVWDAISHGADENAVARPLTGAALQYGPSDYLAIRPPPPPSPPSLLSSAQPPQVIEKTRGLMYKKYVPVQLRYKQKPLVRPMRRSRSDAQNFFPPWKRACFGPLATLANGHWLRREQAINLYRQAPSMRLQRCRQQSKTTWWSTEHLGDKQMEYKRSSGSFINIETAALQNTQTHLYKCFFFWCFFYFCNTKLVSC